MLIHATAFAALPPFYGPAPGAQGREAAHACFSGGDGSATPAPMPTREALKRLERQNPIGPDLVAGGPNPFRAYARFYTARRDHDHVWYCGAYADLSGLGVRPGVYLGGVAKALGGRAYIGSGMFISEDGLIEDGGCRAGHFVFDATAGRLAWFMCNGG
jgi:hypothetical protein